MTAPEFNYDKLYSLLSDTDKQKSIVWSQVPCVDKELRSLWGLDCDFNTEYFYMRSQYANIAARLENEINNKRPRDILLNKALLLGD